MVGVLVSFLGGRTLDTHTQLMMRQGCLHGPFRVGGELLLATHSPRQQNASLPRGRRHGRWIATSSIKPWPLLSSTSLGAN